MAERIAETINRVPRIAHLLLITWASTACFWAWNLVGPLSAGYADRMGLSTNAEALLVATPILVGAVGRIVTGPMTDRFGGRRMMIGVCLAAVPPVLLVGYAGSIGSHRLLMVAGFFLGIAGAAFAVGIPFANNWYEADKRGFSTGVFGMGMVGTALSAFFTPRLVRCLGLFATHAVVAVALALTALACAVVVRNGPLYVANTDPVLPKLITAAKSRVTWEMSFLYALLFGGFVAFSNYLPIYIKTVYGLSLVGAGERTAAFVVAAVLARLAGGVLADRIGAKYVVLAALAGVAVQTSIAVTQPPTGLWASLTFLPLAVALGLGSGGVFAWVTRRAPVGSVGSVTGIVATLGALGGYFPPLVMGATYDPVHNDYTVGLMLLVASSVVLFVYTAVFLPGRQNPRKLVNKQLPKQ